MYKRNLTVRQVSAMTGLSKSAIQKAMDARSNPTVGTLEKIAKGIKVRISDLIDSPYQ